MDQNLRKGAEPSQGEFMERLVTSKPRFRMKQHLVAIGVVFGVTLTGMYLMRDNLEQTMPWKAGKKSS